jgi:hypothetical protein
MPYREPEPDDPHELRGVALPAGPGAVGAMAEAFADEFAQMGFDRARILALFRSPFYAGAHAALALLGEQEVARIVDESLHVLGGRFSVRDTE